MLLTLNHSTNGKVLKVVRGGIRTYSWTSARSLAHHLTLCATARFKTSRSLALFGRPSLAADPAQETLQPAFTGDGFVTKPLG
ncbi:hypothetical protein E2C01_058922 [Portunus trituberculatus]|uniref:Uncharacterized protein n=1 Tax=Portunus trituberculatus TaxID=210409 RepID=A0A5B7GWT8_PORTR|nr:hypothetical protein [Portunus trituberculatus]